MTELIAKIISISKKKYPRNEGPMTAGTASVAESKAIPTEYNYILYIGVMVSDTGNPYILEFNTRTGNPEWLSILGILDRPFIDFIESSYNDIEEIENFWKKDCCSITMYGFSAGYPEVERKYFNENIMNLEKIKKDTDIIGEHIEKRNNDIIPSGGRVFALRYV